MKAKNGKGTGSRDYWVSLTNLQQGRLGSYSKGEFSTKAMLSKKIAAELLGADNRSHCTKKISYILHYKCGRRKGQNRGKTFQKVPEREP